MPQHKWKVIIIMVHDGQTFFEYNDLEQSIINQSKYENIKYTIFYYDDKFSSAVVKKLEYGADYNAYYFKVDPIVPVNDFYEGGALTEFLKGEREKNAADTIMHYMLITWGHGAGLGYFPKETRKVTDKLTDIMSIMGNENLERQDMFLRTINKLKKGYAFYTANLSIDNIKRPYPFISGRVFSEFRNDDKSVQTKIDLVNDFLTSDVKLISARQLDEIITTGLGSQVDIFLNINCYTQMLETGYELKESVKLMMGAQTSLPFAGVNYQKLFEGIENDPGVDLKKIAELIRDEYKFKYLKEPFIYDFKKRYPKYALDEVSFSCNYLEKYKLLSENIINPLATMFIDQIKKNGQWKDFIDTARKRCSDLTPGDNYGIIDFTYFFERLVTTLGTFKKKELTDLYHEYLIIKDQANASFYPAESPDYYYGNADDPLHSPLYLSIFFPDVSKKHEMIDILLDLYTLRSTKPSDFQNDSKWIEFIKLYYGR